MPDWEYSAFSYESVTVGTSATAITSFITTGGATKRGQRAFITVEDNDIRFRYDGTDPTSTEGHVASSGDQFEISGYDDIRRFRAIRHSAAAGDAVLKISLEAF